MCMCSMTHCCCVIKEWVGPGIAHRESAQVYCHGLLLTVLLVGLECGSVVVQDSLGKHGAVVPCVQHDSMGCKLFSTAWTHR